MELRHVGATIFRQNLVDLTFLQKPILLPEDFNYQAKFLVETHPSSIPAVSECKGYGGDRKPSTASMSAEILV